MVNAVIYARVSTKDQEREGYSIPAQLRILREYGDKNGFKIVREFWESESAGKAGRKAFSEMVNLIRTDPSIRVILVEKTDRLYRNFKDQVLIDDLGIDIHFVKDNRVIGKKSKPSDRFVHDIETAQARFYLNNLSQEVKKGQQQKALQGSYPGGMVPIGYHRNPLTKQIELDSERAPLVRQLFELYAEGDKSIDDLLIFVRQALLCYPRSGRTMARSEIERLLKKEFYTGKFAWNGVLYQGDHPAIIDRFVFERVQGAFKARSNGRFTKRQFTFSRLMTCGVCGSAITAEIKKNRYVYYHCTGYKKSHPVTYLPERSVDQQFGQIVSAATIPHDWYEFIRDSLDHELGVARARQAHQRERLELERDKVQTSMKRAFQSHLDGVVSEEFFQGVYNDLQRQLDGLNYRLSHLAESIEENIDLAREAIELSYQAESLY
ncbi:MAG: recombinase family protein, partial [Candidatus Zixiibacteriota bacterium]